jgi:hypothetical protein
MTLPRRLGADDPESERTRWKIVRADTLADVPGLILEANVDTGSCLMRNASGVSQKHDFGPEGLRIVAAERAHTP